MANPLPVARTRVSIGAATTTFNEATVATGPYTIIGGIRSISGFGDSAQVITVDEVGDGRTRKAVGTRNSGTMELVCSLLREDAGQLAAVAASEGFDAFNFKIELPQPGGEFAVYYVSGLVMSQNIGLGGPNDTQTITFSLELTEKPIVVD